MVTAYFKMTAEAHELAVRAGQFRESHWVACGDGRLLVAARLDAPAQALALARQAGVELLRPAAARELAAGLAAKHPLVAQDLA